MHPFDPPPAFPLSFHTHPPPLPPHLHDPLRPILLPLQPESSDRGGPRSITNLHELTVAVPTNCSNYGNCSSPIPFTDDGTVSPHTPALKFRKQFSFGSLNFMRGVNVPPCPVSPKTIKKERPTFDPDKFATNRLLIQTGLLRSSSFVQTEAFGFLSHFNLVQEVMVTQRSTVYMAEHRRTKELFAIKRVHFPLISRKGRDRALNEVKVLRGMAAHPNIVSYYRAWQQDRSLHIQMELCEGGSLENWLQRLSAEGNEGMMPESDVWRVARDVTAALAFLHLHAVVHLDVKPENIFISRKSDPNAPEEEEGLPSAVGVPAHDVTSTPTTTTTTTTPAVGFGTSSTSGTFPHLTVYKLGDFGIARQVAGAGPEEWDEGDGDYVAPELLHEGHPPTRAADVYSLGATLFQCATGHRLPRHRSTSAQEEALRPLSPELSRFIQSMLVEDPHDRPTAVALLDALANHPGSEAWSRPAAPFLREDQSTSPTRLPSTATASVSGRSFTMSEAMGGGIATPDGDAPTPRRSMDQRRSLATPLPQWPAWRHDLYNLMLVAVHSQRRSPDRYKIASFSVSPSSNRDSPVRGLRHGVAQSMYGTRSRGNKPQLGEVEGGSARAGQVVRDYGVMERLRERPATASTPATPKVGISGRQRQASHIILPPRPTCRGSRRENDETDHLPSPRGDRGESNWGGDALFPASPRKTLGPPATTGPGAIPDPDLSPIVVRTPMDETALFLPRSFHKSLPPQEYRRSADRGDGDLRLDDDDDAGLDDHDEGLEDFLGDETLVVGEGAAHQGAEDELTLRLGKRLDLSQNVDDRRTKGHHPAPRTKGKRHHAETREAARALFTLNDDNER